MPIGQETVQKKLEARGTVVVVGMYGTGKGLIVKWLTNERERVGDKVVRISVKDLPIPSEADIPVICGCKSWSQLHLGWRKQAEQIGKRGKKLLIIIEEAQRLIEGGSKLWEIIFSLLYYQKMSVRVILTAQPLILGASDLILRRLLAGNVVYPRKLTLEEVKEYLVDKSYVSAVNRIAHGHYGTVKYVARLIDEQNFTGAKLTEKRVHNWAQERGEMDYFVQMVWEGLSKRQQMGVREYLHRKNIKDDKLANELVNVGVLWRGGGKLEWCIPWTEMFVKEWVARQKVERKEIDEVVLKKMGKKERLLLTKLIARRGEIVTYDELAESVWGENAEFSLWALSRLLGRVRGKVREAGVGESVESVRGVGYRLD